MFQVLGTFSIFTIQINIFAYIMFSIFHTIFGDFFNLRDFLEILSFIGDFLIVC